VKVEAKQSEEMSASLQSEPAITTNKIPTKTHQIKNKAHASDEK
jgi:hypothetical protein